jgi:hypothetical protein
MAIYKVTGSYEEFYETVIEADSSDLAIQIFYQNAGHLSSMDGNWVDINIDDEFENEEELEKNNETVEFNMENYDPQGGKIRV